MNQADDRRNPRHPRHRELLLPCCASGSHLADTVADDLESVGYEDEAYSLRLAARDWTCVVDGSKTKAGWRLAWAAPDLASLTSDYADLVAEVLAARDAD